MEDHMERTISDVTVHIDRTLCIGSGNCVNLAPEVFELDENNLVTFREETPDIDPERLTEACALCPVDALMAFDEEGEQLVP